MEELLENIKNNTLTEEQKKLLMKIVGDYFFQKEQMEKSIEANKGIVFGRK